MSLTKSFRDAALADMATVSGLRVYPVAHSNEGVETPCGMLWPEETGDGDPAQITNRQGERRQRFGFRLLVRSPNDDAVLDLFDDVCNAFEKTGSAISAVTGFIMADVVEWSRPLTGSDISYDGWAVEAILEIRYFYARGSL